jgi:hypothetical protein
VPTYLTADQLSRDLALRDLTDPNGGAHAVQLLVDRAADALVTAWGVVNEEVRSASAVVVVGHDTQVDLNAVPRGEAVAASCVGTDGEAESLVVLPRRIEVIDGKDRRYAFHGVSLAEAGVRGGRDSSQCQPDQRQNTRRQPTRDRSDVHAVIGDRAWPQLPARMRNPRVRAALPQLPGLFPPSEATTRLMNLRRFTAGRTL